MECEKMTTKNGRTPVYSGKRFDELTDEEKFTKYGTTHFSEGVQNGLRLIEEGGINKAYEKALKLEDKEKEDIITNKSIEEKVKTIVRKLLENVELTEEEEIFLVGHEAEIERELG